MFQPGTVALGLVALEAARRQGLSFRDRCRFAGYVVEAIRQKGSEQGERQAVIDYLAGAEKSKHRYAKGRNAGNYEYAGRRLVCQHLREAKITFDVVGQVLYTALYDGEDCSYALHDWLEGEGHTTLAGLLS